MGVELVCDTSACASWCVTSFVREQERKVAAAKMLQNGWRAYHEQKAKKPKFDSEGGGVPENSILNEPLFYKAALQYAQMRAESVNGLVPLRLHLRHPLSQHLIPFSCWQLASMRVYVRVACCGGGGGYTIMVRGAV